MATTFSRTIPAPSAQIFTRTVIFVIRKAPSVLPVGHHQWPEMECAFLTPTPSQYLRVYRKLHNKFHNKQLNRTLNQTSKEVSSKPSQNQQEEQ
jgi:hypothetical protein